MATFSFNTKALKEYGKLQAQRAKEAAKLIAPTPFNFDYEEVEKSVLIFIGNNNPYVAKRQNLKGRKFTAVSDAFGLMTPTLSKAAMLIAFYIMTHIEFNTNIIKITENDFRSFTGMGETAFNEAMKELIRPELDYRSGGDSIKLLAKTTRQSIYVVNHNFIFKGSLETFGIMLKDIYPNGCKLDSKGKVILER